MIVRSMLALATVFMFGLMLSAPMVSATAQAPTWTQGDAWAIGKTVDLDAEFAQQLQDLEDMIKSSTNPSNVALNEFNIQAMASAYLLFKVDTVNETEVHLKGDYAVKFTGDASISISADMEKPGIYQWDDEIPKERRTMSADVNVDMAMVVEMEVVLEKDTGAVKSISMSIKVDMTGSANLVNIPSGSSNWTSTTVAYENYDVSADFNFFMNLDLEFLPALNIYDFPLSVGDEWIIESTAVLTGSYGGSIDVNGLPADIEAGLFSADVLMNAGVNSFPIDLAQVIHNSDKPSMNDGVIGPESVVIGPITANCVSETEITIPNHGLVSKYKIMTDGDGEYYYIDGINIVSGMQEVVNELGIVDQLPAELPVDAEMLSMDSVSSAQAEQEIQAIADYRAQIAGESSSSGNGSVNLDATLLLIVLAIIAVVIVLAFLMLRKKPKAL
jgi:hypothetical protein